MAGESKHRALAEDICALAVQLKPLQQGSVGPENLCCILSPSTQEFLSPPRIELFTGSPGVIVFIMSMSVSQNWQEISRMAMSSIPGYISTN